MRRAARGGRAARAGGARLTRRGVVCVVASAIGFIGAYALDFRQLLYVAIALAAMPLIALALVRARRPRLSVTRSFSPPVVAAGSSATVTLHVRNLAAAPTMRVTCWDEVPWEDDNDSGTELPVLQPRGARFNRQASEVIVTAVTVREGDGLGAACSHSRCVGGARLKRVAGEGSQVAFESQDAQ